MYIVAIPKEGNIYDWIATFDDAATAESYAIKFVDAIVVQGVELWQ